ncbi:ubiquitin-transferase domain-containing protein [Cyclospora cayetanensis]|uniref:Ubiquitin-transferase domain-containing protein n=1 Tax=Cyclospora cayetanensis TaxID=88456 RepID=A0A1D3DAG0_9EIME|nr:ubiquitin-transferase domain-containing protein [Cyclospora cayetanensis]
MSGRLCIMTEESLGTGSHSKGGAKAAEKQEVETPRSNNSLWEVAHTIDYRSEQQLLEQPQDHPEQQHALEDLACWCVSRAYLETASSARYLFGECNSWHRKDLLLQAASDEAAPLFYGLPSATVSVSRCLDGNSSFRCTGCGSELSVEAAVGAKASAASLPAASASPSAAVPAAAGGNLVLPSVFSGAAAEAAPFVILLLYLHNLLQHLPTLRAYACIASSCCSGGSTEQSPEDTKEAAAATLFRAAASARSLSAHPLDLEGGASLPRTKVKMPRSHLTESAAKVMDHLLASSRSVEEQPLLEVEFAGEEGVGLGPTNEFYAEVLESVLTHKDPELFVSCSSSGGLFPRAYITDLSLIPVEMVRRPRVSPLMMQQSQQQQRSSRASTRLAGSVASPPGEAENMEEDGGSLSRSNSGNFSPHQDAVAAEAAASAGWGDLERELFKHFRLLGQLAAKVLLDGRSSTTDTGLHALFWEAVARPLLQQERLRPCSCMRPLTKAEADVATGAQEAAALRLGVCRCGSTIAAISAVAAVDEALAKSLQKMMQHRAAGFEVADLSCFFVLPHDRLAPQCL